MNDKKLTKLELYEIAMRNFMRTLTTKPYQARTEAVKQIAIENKDSPEETSVVIAQHAVETSLEVLINILTELDIIDGQKELTKEDRTRVMIEAAKQANEEAIQKAMQ